MSDSAGRSDTATEQLAGCQPEAVVGALHAQGCLFDDSDRWLAVGALSINGLQLAPVGRVSASLYKSPVRLAVNGTVAIKAGGRTLWQGPALGWSTADTLKLKIPEGTVLYGLPLTGDLSLSLSAEDGGAVDGEASADLGGVTADALLDPLKAGGLLRAALEPEGHASVKLRWSRDRGFELDHVSLVGKRLQLGAAAAPFSLSDFNLTYEHSGNDDIFTGEAGFGGPFSPIVRPKVTIVNGQLAGIGLAVDQLNEPLPPPAELVFVQKLGFEVNWSPAFQVSGSGALSLGPSVGGLSAARVDGTLTYTPQGTCPRRTGKYPMVKFTGQTTIVILDGPSGYVCWNATPDGTALIGIGGAFKLDLDDISAELHADGFVDGVSHITLDGTATLKISNLFTGTGDAVISERGLSICTDQALHIPNAPAQFATLTWGLTLPWGATPTPLCGTDRMRTVNASATQAGAGGRASARATTLTLPAAGAGVLAIAGHGSAPAVRLRGPHGHTITIRDPRHGLRAAGVLAFAAGKTTYVLLDGRLGGQWTVTTLSGQIARIGFAAALAPVSAQGTLSPAGRRIRLRFTATPERGQRLVFFEQGPDLARSIGSSTAAHGTLTFTPTSAASTRADGQRRRRAERDPAREADARALSERRPRRVPNPSPRGAQRTSLRPAPQRAHAQPQPVRDRRAARPHNVGRSRTHARRRPLPARAQRQRRRHDAAATPAKPPALADAQRNRRRRQRDTDRAAAAGALADGRPNSRAAGASSNRSGTRSPTANCSTASSSLAGLTALLRRPARRHWGIARAMRVLLPPAGFRWLGSVGAVERVPLQELVVDQVDQRDVERERAVRVQTDRRVA